MRLNDQCISGLVIVSQMLLEGLIKHLQMWQEKEDSILLVMILHKTIPIKKPKKKKTMPKTMTLA